MNWIWPLVFFALIVGVAAFLLWQSQPALEGELSAHRLPDFEIPPQLVDRGSIDRPADEVTAVLERLQDEPIPQANTRHWMTLHLKPADRGLTVHVGRTGGTEVFRVDPLADPALRTFIREQIGPLSTRRHQALSRAATAFMKALAAAQKSGQAFDTSAWRYELAVPAQTGPFGYVVEAVTSKRPSPCIYEDGEGRLYFLLPRDTKRFILRGRELPDGSKLFPGRYVVRVEADPDRPTPNTDATPADEATDTNSAPDTAEAADSEAM